MRTFNDQGAAVGMTASRAVPVFPCRPRGKEPLTPHGFEDATTDLARIEAWWKRWPEANIAMPTGPLSGFDVLDVDVRAKGSGWAALDRLRRADLLRGAVRTVKTPSGGLHIYFPASGHGCGSIAGQFLDFKADGGYVLLPPSYVVAQNGGCRYQGAYEEVDARPSAGGKPLNWRVCRDLLAPPRVRIEPRPAGGDGRFLTAWLQRQGEGNRNNGLFWAACRALESGSDLVDLVDAAVAAGLRRNEAERTVASALRHRGVSR